MMNIRKVEKSIDLSFVRDLADEFYSNMGLICDLGPMTLGLVPGYSLGVSFTKNLLDRGGPHERPIYQN